MEEGKRNKSKFNAVASEERSCIDFESANARRGVGYLNEEGGGSLKLEARHNEGRWLGRVAAARKNTPG